MATKKGNKAASAVVSSRAAAEQLKGGTAVTSYTPSSGPLALPAGVKAVKALTLPSLVIKEQGRSETVLFLENPRISKVVDKKSQKEPATVARVAVLPDGEEKILLIPAVVLSNLGNEYYTGPALKDGEKYDPEGIEVKGKAFFLRNDGKRTPTQRYNDFTIVEVEPTK